MNCNDERTVYFYISATQQCHTCALGGSCECTEGIAICCYNDIFTLVILRKVQAYTFFVILPS